MTIMTIFVAVLYLTSLSQFPTLRADEIQQKHFFRKHYTYLPTTESFYKIRKRSILCSWAKSVCASEGAELFYPENKAEADAVTQLWQQYGTDYSYDRVLVGFKTPLKNGFDITDRGTPNNKNCVTMHRNGTFNEGPCLIQYHVICKKTLASLQWNKPCNTPDMDYTYNEVTGKCYKFHLTPKAWPDAFMKCHGEESYLAVINNQVEAKQLVELTKNALKDNVFTNYKQEIVILGFYYSELENEWITILGQLLKDSGYNYWGYSEPYSQECGSMFYNGTLNSIDCDQKAFFICEHDVQN